MADVGTGLTIAFEDTGFSAEILSVNGTDISRESIATSHMGTTTWLRFMPSDLADPGGLEIEIAFAPDNNLEGTSQPPITSDPEKITVTFPIYPGQNVAAYFDSQGFATNWSWGAPLEDKMTASLTIKLTGDDTNPPTFHNAT